MCVFLAFGVDLGYLLYYFCRELREIRGKFSHFQPYPLTLLFTNKGRTFSSEPLHWNNRDFEIFVSTQAFVLAAWAIERGVFIVLVWSGL